MEQGRGFQLERREDCQVWTERQQVSEEKGVVLFWCGRDAGVKQPGEVETGCVQVWAEGAAGCTEVVCRASSQGWAEA